MFQQKNYSSDATHLEKTVALGMDDAHLHDFLGICYSQSNHASKAMREHLRSIQLDPPLAEAHLNLAYEYQRLHQLKAAIPEYKKACELDAQFCKSVPQ